MGCGASKSYEGKAFIVETASQLELARIQDAIKKNDLFLFNKCSGLTKLNENFGEPGDSHTCLHLAAHYDSYIVLGHILKHLRESFPAKFHALVNIQNKNKQTAVLMAVKRDNVLSFSILFQFNACDFNLRDMHGKTLMEYINQSQDCKEYFETHSKSKPHIKKSPEPASPELKQAKSRNSKFLHPSDVITDQILQKINIKFRAHEVYKKCLETKEPFVDSEFPHKLESITLDKSEPHYADFEKAIWRRPNEFLQAEFDNIKVFDNISPNDIIQGKLGVSYFLACLSSMAEFPTRIVENFIIKETNTYGVYSVKFYHRGVPTEIVIDDYFPCDASDPNKPLFASAKGCELWVMILEKAWGKLFKRYTDTESGDALWAFQNLTYAPAHTYQTKTFEQDDLFEVLSEADLRNWMCACKCQANGNIKSSGLVDKEYYALIGAFDINGKKLLKLRNAWGKKEFKGEYAENSEKWTDSMKRQVGFVRAEDGMFFMSLEEFSNNFSSFTVCFFHDNWYYEHDTVSMNGHHAMYHVFEIKEVTNAYFRIHQPDERSKQVSEPSYKTSPAEISVCMVKIDDSLRDIVDDYKEKDSTSNEYGINSLTNSGKFVQLAPGKYIIRSKVQWRREKEENFTISLFSSKSIHLKIQAEKIKDYHKRRNMMIAGKNKQKKTLKDGIVSCEGWGDTNIYYYYIKNESSKEYECDWILKNPEIYKLKKSLNNISNTQVKIKLGPKSEEIILLKKVELGSKDIVSYEIEDNILNL